MILNDLELRSRNGRISDWWARSSLGQLRRLVNKGVLHKDEVRPIVNAILVARAVAIRRFERRFPGFSDQELDLDMALEERDSEIAPIQLYPEPVADNQLYPDDPSTV